MVEWLMLPWEEILVPHHPIEMLIRGTLAYLGLLLLLRVFLQRQAGSMAASDILVTVLIADAIQNGMAGEYKSVPDGLVLVATIIAWDYVVDFLSFHFKFIDRLVNASPVMLIKNHRLLKKNMRRELITADELWSKLRQEGVSTLTQVKIAFLENDGEISVVKEN